MIIFTDKSTPLGDTPAAVQAAVKAEVVDFAARLRDAASASITITLVPSIYGEGRWSLSINKAAQQADGMDYALSSMTLNADGSHFDDDPVKPWELA